MSAQLANIGMSFERIPAFDSVAVETEWLERHFRRRGPLGTVPKGDQCCSLSHQRAWATFLAGRATHTVILEDDVLLDPAAAEFLRRTDWVPPNVDLIKLEHFGPEGQRVLVGEPVEITAGRRIAPIHSRHTGAAAYILSRRGADRLLAQSGDWQVPVDHLLFNPNVSPMAAELRPYQILPAVARQHGCLGGSSDIVASRRVRKTDAAYIKREMIRAYYETRLLPQQILKVLRGQARLMKVSGHYAQWQLPELHAAEQVYA